MPTVVIDQWWDHDYAKNACQSRRGTQNPCVGDPVIDAIDFEAQIAAAFAADTSCHGVTLIRFAGPGDTTTSDLNAPAWWSIDFSAGEIETQGWKINHNPDSQHKAYYGYATGEATPRQIAHEVCGIAMGRGGSIVN